MSFKDDLIQWQEAIDAFHKGRHSRSIKSFNKVTDVGARIFFDIGVVYSSVDRHEDAIISFTNATILDPYFAVAYFQLGVTQWIVRRFQDAADSLTMALHRMRNNRFIDYTQIGLEYRMLSFEVVFNRALCQFALKRNSAARKDLRLAQKHKSIPEHSEEIYRIESIMKDIHRGRLGDYLPFAVPEGLLFRPPQIKLENVDKVDYLGSSKVLVNLDSEDAFVVELGGLKLKSNALEVGDGTGTARSRVARQDVKAANLRIAISQRGTSTGSEAS